VRTRTPATAVFITLLFAISIKADAFNVSNEADQWISNGEEHQVEGDRGGPEYVLNPERLDIWLHTAALFALLEVFFIGVSNTFYQIIIAFSFFSFLIFI
jgi:hypothetical protein